MELLEIKVVKYVLGQSLCMLKNFLNVPRHYKLRLLLGVGSDPSEKKVSLSLKNYCCKRKTLGRMFYPLFGQGGLF